MGTNIKLNDTLIKNVSLTYSGDLLGIRFATDMILNDLAILFDANTSPEVRVIEDEEIVKIYKNRNIVSLSVSNINSNRTVDIVLGVIPTNISEVEALEIRVKKQNATILEQIEVQSTQIVEQETEINNLKMALADAETKITESEMALAEAQSTNAMLMECVLEMSEVVYA